MTKRIHIVAFGMALLLATSIVSASAFTSATVERDASVSVATDADAVVGLEEGSVNGISTDTDGELQLNLDEGSGLNVDTTFKFGSTSSPTYAFRIENNGGQSYDFSAKYVLDSSDPNSNVNNVHFDLYDTSNLDTVEYDFSEVATTDSSSDWNSLGTFSAYSGSGDTGVKYVIITVDTTALDGNTDDLSGTLKIKAE
jgi:hypothetical protein